MRLERDSKSLERAASRGSAALERSSIEKRSRFKRGVTLTSEGKLKRQIRALRDKIRDLKGELAEKQKLAEEYLTRLKYTQADFENYKKAMDRENEKIIKSANQRLVVKLLDVYENLERGVETAKKHNDEGAILHGIELTHNQLKEALKGEGLEPIKSVGEKFDPFRHEALMREPKDDCEEGTILEEFQRGYTLNGRVIRYSKVKVSERPKKLEDRMREEE